MHLEHLYVVTIGNELVSAKFVGNGFHAVMALRGKKVTMQGIEDPVNDPVSAVSHVARNRCHLATAASNR